MKKVLIIMLVMFPGLTLAEGTFSTGYLSKTELAPGTIVSLTANAGVVTAAGLSNSVSLLGVVTVSPAITLSSDAADVRVVSQGLTDTLVTTFGGSIRAGDRITTSELTGVGAKLNGSGKVLGIAQSSFDNKTSGAKSKTLTDATGNKRAVAIGLIPVAVSVTDYKAESTPSIVSSSVQLMIDRLAGRKVSPRAVVGSLILLTLGIITAGIILHGAINGGMLSIGRNPLAKRRVFQGFGWAMLMAGGILVVCVAIAYAIILFIP